MFSFLQEREYLPQKHTETERQTVRDRQTDTAEVMEEVSREGPSDASRWSDEGREERRGEAQNQDDKTKCLSAVLKALISLYIQSAPMRPPYARLWGRGDSI